VLASARASGQQAAAHLQQVGALAVGGDAEEEGLEVALLDGVVDACSGGMARAGV
jgi:hypothetical protein